MKTKTFFYVFYVLVLSGCKTIGPAAFWNNFDDGHIVKNISDQGSWGGYRLIYWKNAEKPYKAKDVVAFATLHQWEYCKIDSLTKEEMINWVLDHADSLSLHHPANYPPTGGTGVSLTFEDSNWVATKSDTTKAALGYILLSSDGKELVVYHTWGE